MGPPQEVTPHDMIYVMGGDTWVVSLPPLETPLLMTGVLYNKYNAGGYYSFSEDILL